MSFVSVFCEPVSCFRGPLWWCADRPTGSTGLFRFFGPLLEPVACGFRFCCSNTHPLVPVSVLAIYCCMTKHHTTLWLKLTIYLLFFSGACELSGLWWVLFTGGRHAASLRLRWGSPESSGGWTSKVICLHTGRWHWMSTGSSVRAAEWGTWGSLNFSWHRESGFWAGTSWEQGPQETGHACGQSR